MHLRNKRESRNKGYQGFDGNTKWNTSSRKARGTFDKRNGLKRVDPTEVDIDQDFEGFVFTVPFERSLEDEEIEDDYYNVPASHFTGVER